MYLKPDFQTKILRFFHEIDQKPMHQNMYDMMQSYIDTKNSDCNVSKASNELMLNRISGGKEIEFPFIKQ